MRTCGRVVPLASTWKRWRGGSCSCDAHTKCPLEIAGDTQPLGIFGLVIERAAGALRHLGAVELGQDLIDAGGGRRHRVGDVLIAQRAITLAVLREIEQDDRNVLALGVGPDVGFGPMQDRMDAYARLGGGEALNGPRIPGADRARPSRLPARAARTRAPWRGWPRRGECRRSGRRNHIWSAPTSGLRSCARRSARPAAGSDRRRRSTDRARS